MRQGLKRILYFLLGLCGLLGLLCSVAAAQVTNSALMKEGFLKYAQTAHLSVPPSRYGDYAAAITAYLNGKTDAIRVPDPETPEKTTEAFSEKENLHLKDVRRIVSALKLFRWIDGGGAAAALAALYLLKKQDRPRLIASVLRGFSAAALAILLVSLALGVWGIVNFSGLFWTFHQVAFTNDLWLLNPQTDLLVALMPLGFFTWYAGEMLKALLPILGVMILLVIAYLKTKERA